MTNITEGDRGKELNLRTRFEILNSKDEVIATLIFPDVVSYRTKTEVVPT